MKCHENNSILFILNKGVARGKCIKSSISKISIKIESLNINRCSRMEGTSIKFTESELINDLN